MKNGTGDASTPHNMTSSTKPPLKKYSVKNSQALYNQVCVGGQSQNASGGQMHGDAGGRKESRVQARKAPSIIRAANSTRYQRNETTKQRIQSIRADFMSLSGSRVTHD
jgi:hypothetical protein